MKYFQIWRRWVAWQRSLFIQLGTKRPVKWANKLNDLLKILMSALQLASESHPDLEVIPEPQPEPQQESQNPYDTFTTGRERIIHKVHPRTAALRRKK